MVAPHPPEEFARTPGLDDWTVRDGSARARFLTGSFAAGVALIDAIAVLADRADHHPDIDLRYREVAVRLTTHEVGGLSERDVALAREITTAARTLGIRAADR